MQVFESPTGLAPSIMANLLNFFFQVLNYFGEYFCLHVDACSIRSAPVYMAFLSFMGNDADSCNYRYRLEIKGNGRKVIFEGIPRSIRESQRRIMENGDGLVVMRNMLQFLGGETRRRNLEVTGRTWNTQIPLCASCMDKIIKSGQLI